MVILSASAPVLSKPHVLVSTNDPERGKAGYSRLVRALIRRALWDGAVAGGLHVHPHSDYLFANDTRYLLRFNLLNACSVFIVLAVAYPLKNMRGLNVKHMTCNQPI